MPDAATHPRQRLAPAPTACSRDAGYAFDVVAPREQVECGICSTGGPAALVTELAMSKAVDVAAQLKDRGDLAGAPAVILACDTVAECGGEILGKPADEAHARSMLERLRGSVHRVYSGVCVWQPPQRRRGRARRAARHLRAAHGPDQRRRPRRVSRQRAVARQGRRVRLPGSRRLAAPHRAAASRTSSACRWSWPPRCSPRRASHPTPRRVIAGEVLRCAATDSRRYTSHWAANAATAGRQLQVSRRNASAVRTRRLISDFALHTVL